MWPFYIVHQRFLPSIGLRYLSNRMVFKIFNETQIHTDGTVNLLRWCHIKKYMFTAFIKIASYIIKWSNS